MSKTIDFNEHKAKMTQDSRDWSPLEALKALVRDIESGEIVPDGSLAVLLWAKDQDGESSKFYQSYAGLTNETATSLLSLALHRVLTTWDGV